jgi:serine protease inhibitor
MPSHPVSHRVSVAPTAIVALLLALALTLLAGCDSSRVPTAPVPARPLTAAEQAVVRGSNAFAFRLLNEVLARDTTENTILSPLSASLALGMTANGARGETLDSMLAVLGFRGLDADELNRSAKGISDLILKLDPKVDMRVANSVWANEGFPFHESFFEAVRQWYDAEARTLPFADPATLGIINGWVQANTGGKIDKILDVIPPQAVMYLINALYFKGDWTYRFDPARTRPADFTTVAGERTAVKLMDQIAELPYAEVDGVQLVELPYASGGFAMTLVLPAPGQRIDDVARGLDAGRWAEWVAALEKQEVQVQLPRFRAETDKVLNDPLIALGMGIAFGLGAADFSGLSPAGRDLAISMVRQKTFIQVDELGTEAAAVTAVEISRTSMPARPVFRADRPFLLAIRERSSGALLFLGRIGAPAE